jgi:hypothetical protein
MLMSEEFLMDWGAGRNADESKALKWWILNYVDKRTSVTADDIYRDSECGDIAMYLALHDLVINGLIEGPSPYQEELRGTKHEYWIYKKALGGNAQFFTAVSRDMAKAWDPEEWREPVCSN